MKTRPGAGRGWLALLLIAGIACGREPRPRPEAGAMSVDVFADTARSLRLVISPPDTADWAAAHSRAAVWLAQVARAREPAADSPLPDAPPAEVDSGLPAPPRLAGDGDLKPPVLRTPGRLRVPARFRAAWVELDVRVTEDGTTSDALWAGGSSDSVLVAAAIDCALEMRFFPALREGRAVAVWCRQRFDFESR